MTPWAPRRGPLKRCEKKRSWLQRVHRSTRSTDATPAWRSARSTAVQRSRRRPVDEIRVEQLRHLRADLVAAGPDRRPDDRRRATGAQSADGRLHDSAGEPTPTRVDDGERRPCRPSGRLRSGRSRRRGRATAAKARPSRARRPPRLSAPGRARFTRRRVPLAVHRKPRRVEPERLAGDAPVLGDPRRGRPRGCRGSARRSRRH